MLCWLLGVSFGQACADYTKENPFLLVLLIVLGVAFVGVGGFILYLFIMGKKKASIINETENAEGTETAQSQATAQTAEVNSEAKAEETAEVKSEAKAEETEEVKSEAKAEETEEAKSEAKAEETEVVETTETTEVTEEKAEDNPQA